MRRCSPRSWGCQLLLLVDLLLFVAGAALGGYPTLQAHPAVESAQLEAIEPSPESIKRRWLHWLFRRQDEDSDDEQGGDGDSDNQDYDSTTTLVVTSTRSSSNTPTSDSNSGSSEDDDSGDDDDGGNTSQTAWIIAGSGVGALALIGGIFYFATKDKDLNWMDLLTANKDSKGSEMSEMNNKPPPSQMPMGGSGFGGGMPPPPPGDPFGGAGSQPPIGPMPDAPYYDPTGIQNQPVPQPGTFAPQFPPAGPPPPQQMGPPMQGMGGSARSGSSSASSSSSSSKSSKRRGGGYKKSAFTGATSNTYDPTVHHDRPHSPDKSQFFAPSEGAGGYAVTSVSRMFDVHGNRINQPKFKGKVTGPNGSVKDMASDSGSGYGMMRSRTGTPASMSSISKGVRRLSGRSGASSFKSGKSGRTAGTGITRYSWANSSKDEDNASYAPTSVSRNKPRRFGSNELDASSFTGRSFSSSRLAPRSLGRSVPLSARSGGGSARRGRGGSSRDDASGFSDDSGGSGGRSLGSSALTSRTAGTKMGAPGSSAFKSSGFGSQSGFKNKGLMLSNSDFEASRSGLTSSAGLGRAGQKNGRGLAKIAERNENHDEDDESAFESLLRPSSQAGPTTLAARRYLQGGAAGGKSEARQSSSFGPSSAPGRNITLTPSDLTYASGSSKMAGSGLTGQTRR